MFWDLIFRSCHALTPMTNHETSEKSAVTASTTIVAGVASSRSCQIEVGIRVDAWRAKIIHTPSWGENGPIGRETPERPLS